MRRSLQAIKSCVATAGFSVGEYAALVFAGILSYSDSTASLLHYVICILDNYCTLGVSVLVEEWS